MPNPPEFQEKLQPPVLAEKYPSFTESERRIARHQQITIDGDMKEALPLFVEHSQKYNIPLFLTVSQKDNEIVVDIVNYPRDKYYPDGERYASAYVTELIKTLNQGDIPTAAATKPHNAIEDSRALNFETTIGRKPGYDHSQPDIPIAEINQLLKRSIEKGNFSPMLPTPKINPVDIIAISPNQEHPEEGPTIYQEPGIKIFGTREFIPIIMDLAYSMKQERFAIELLRGQNPQLTYLVEVDNFCQDPDIRNHEQVNFLSHRPTPRNPAAHNWRRNYSHVFDQRGHSLELISRLDQVKPLSPEKSSLRAQEVHDKIESVAETYDDIIKSKLEISLNNQQIIRQISNASQTITSWINFWVHPNNRQGEIDPTKPQYPQVQKIVEKQYPKSTPEYESWWASLQITRFLALECSSAKTIFAHHLGYNWNQVLSSITKSINPELITSPEAFQIIASLTQAPDLDMGIFPGDAYYMIFEEIEKERLFLTFLEKSLGHLPVIIDYEDPSHFTLELNIPINSKDIQLPPGAKLQSNTVYFQYQRDELKFDPILPYAELGFFVKIYHPETDTTTNFSLLTHEFSLTHTHENTINQDTRTGLKATLHGQSIAASVDHHKYYPIINAGEKLLETHPNPNTIVFGIWYAHAQRLLRSDQIGPFFSDMAKSEQIFHNDGVAQLVSRFLVNRIFSLPYVMDAQNKHPLWQEYPLFKQLARKFNPSKLSPEIVKEMETNIRRSWLIDPLETIYFLGRTGFNKFFPLIDQFFTPNIKAFDNHPTFYMRVEKNLPLEQSHWNDFTDLLQNNLPEELKDLNPLELMMKLTTLDRD